MKDRIELANKALRLEKAIKDIKAEIKALETSYCDEYIGLSKQEVFEIIDKHINGIRKETT